MATTDTEHYARLILLIQEGGSCIIKQIIEQETKNSTEPTLNHILRKEKATLKQQKREGRVHKRQYRLLFPENGTDSDIDTWDLPLLIQIVLLLFKNVLSPNGVHAIEGIQKIRNEYCHMGNLSLARNTFRTKTAELTTHMYELVENFSEQMQDKIHNMIEDFTRGPLDLTTAIERVREMCRHDDIMEGVLSELSKLRKCQRNIVSEFVAAVKPQYQEILEMLKKITPQNNQPFHKEIPLIVTKLQISGEKEEFVALAEKVLLKVFQVAINNVEDRSNNTQVTMYVNKLLSDIANLNAEATDATDGSIFISIRCNTIQSLYGMLQYFTDHNSTKTLPELALAIGQMFDQNFEVNLSVTDESLGRLLEWIGEFSTANEHEPLREENENLAEIYGKEDAETAGDINKGSEEVLNCCGPCNSESKLSTAVGFCDDCNECMCVTCIAVHNKLSITKSHVIKTDIVSISQVIPDDEQYSLTELCPCHSDKAIMLYCNSHDQFGCDVCISLHHRNCIDVVYIPDITHMFAENTESKQVYTDLKKLHIKLSFNKKSVEYIGEERDKRYFKTKSEIEGFKHAIDSFLSESEKVMLSMISKQHSTDEEKETNVLTKCDELIFEVENMLAKVSETKTTGNYKKLFIAVKLAKASIPKIENQLDKMDQCRKPNRYIFQRDSKLASILASNVGMGILSEASPSEDFNALGYKNVKSQTDTKVCHITGVVVLPDGGLALADYNNISVKLIDVKERKITTQISLSSSPMDLTVVEHNHLAVSLKNKRKIQILKLGKTLTKGNYIAISGLCVGIEYSANKLILCIRYPVRHIQIVDMSGNVLRAIQTDLDDNYLFANPKCIALSPDHTLMYVGDAAMNTVTCLSTDGELIFVYKNDQLKTPCGIAVDGKGIVYVCSRNSNTLHQIKPYGALMRVIQLEEYKVKFPLAMAHCEKNDTLYMSSGSVSPNIGNNIRVFQVE